ncbi:MAG TPA: cupin domain-containing protein [Patescibacteria group bacterium]
MKGYKANIEQLTLENENFRQVLYTAKHVQLVVMNLKPGEEIGLEVHDVDQFFRFEKGEGKVVIDGTEQMVSDGDVVIVPSGAEHNVVNASSSESLKLYTLYCPPHHQDGTVHSTKEDALTDDEHFDGTTTESVL